jgi:hypothetical protein
MARRQIQVCSHVSAGSPKPRARDQPAGRDQKKVEEKLKGDKTNENLSRAMLREPPDAQEKQDAKQWLITMQDWEGSTTVNGEDQ